MRLIPLTQKLAAELAEGDFSAVRFSNIADADAPLREVAKACVNLYRLKAPTVPWIGYLSEDETSGRVVGSCGYNGGCREGIVEIAYFSFPGHEGRGFATEMARLLTDMALHQPDVRIVCAHTLKEGNASVRILRRLGFACVGTVQDPDEGPVWRWELKRS